MKLRIAVSNQAKGGRIFPEIIQPKLMKAKIPSQFHNNRKVYIASVSSDDHLYYIASKEDSAAAFELLWDANKKVMVHLSVASGFCYGNERKNFTRNTLLKYRGNYYLLRSTDNWRYTKVVYFRGNALQEICHADYTAPEI